eukprot:m.236612 g.236612  ORF g.236612 m.236612 type:complete len:73 (+) comp33689_c0_seq1:1653-1871(+)
MNACPYALFNCGRISSETRNSTLRFPSGAVAPAVGIVITATTTAAVDMSVNIEFAIGSLDRQRRLTSAYKYE